MSSKPVRGSFLWYELMSKDPAGSLAFYPKVLGYSTIAMPMPQGEYTMLTRNGVQFAGVYQLPQQAADMGAPSHWLGYIGTPDVDATVAEVKALGGQAYMAGEDIPGVGRIAVLADPWGATFAVFRPESGTTDNMQDAGAVTWNELATADLQAGFDFYAKLFGWTIIDKNDMGEMGQYWIYGNGGAPLGGMFKKPDSMPVCAWMYYQTVSDLDGVIAGAQAANATLMMGPHTVPGGDRIAHLMDPQGAHFSLHTSPAK